MTRDTPESRRERRRRATDAAVRIARGFGLDPREPRVLKDSNNTVIHLAPEPVVAKLSTSTLQGRGPGSLELELDVARHLAARGAPIAPPTSEPGPGPHREDGMTITLWELRVHEPDLADDPEAIAGALGTLHDALSDYPGELPPFSAHLEIVRDALEPHGTTPEMPREDRAFLLRVVEQLMDELASAGLDMRPLHGGPHLDGNVLVTADGPVFIDFEAACRGPIEWDLSHLPDPVVRHVPNVDHDLLRTMRNATSVCVATWCWSQPARAPEVDEAARFHLERLRRLVGSERS